MTRFISSLLLLTFFAVAIDSASAKTDMLDLVPHNALGVIAFKSVNETGKRLNNISNDTGIRPGIQPAIGIQMALAWLGATGGLDRDAPIAIILPDARKLKSRSYNTTTTPEPYIVVALPYSNLSQLARCFNASPKKLKAGETVKGKGTVFGKFFKVKGTHLYLGNNQKTLEDVIATRSAKTKMRPQQIKEALKGDILLHLGTRSWGKEWGMLMAEIQRGKKMLDFAITGLAKSNKQRNRFPYLKEDAVSAKKLLLKFEKLMIETEFGIFTIRYDKGLGISGMHVFREDKTGEIKKLLTEFCRSTSASSLNALANKNMLFAMGHSAFSKDVEFMLRFSMVESLSEFNLISHENVKIIYQKKQYLPFTQQFLKLKNSRGAIYLNKGRLSKGWISCTSIIEQSESKTLLASIKKQALKINPAGTDLHLNSLNEQKQKTAQSELEIAKLIVALGDSHFDVRVNATTQLIEIGDFALDALQQASKHRDKEIALRAQQLINQLSGKMTNSRIDGLPLLFPLLANSNYTYTPEAETIAGQQVDVISLHNLGSNKASETHFTQLLGTDWKHMRLIPINNKLIAHWGSNIASLEETLKNIKSNQAGLVEHTSSKEHREESSHPQKMQLHFSLTNLVPFFTEDPQKIMTQREKKSVPFSSANITIDEEQLQIDIWVPKEDLKNAFKGQKLDEMNSLFQLLMRFG